MRMDPSSAADHRCRPALASASTPPRWPAGRGWPRNGEGSVGMGMKEPPLHPSPAPVAGKGGRWVEGVEGVCVIPDRHFWSYSLVPLKKNQRGEIGGGSPPPNHPWRFFSEVLFPTGGLGGGDEKGRCGGRGVLDPLSRGPGPPFSLRPLIAIEERSEGGEGDPPPSHTSLGVEEKKGPWEIGGGAEEWGGICGDGSILGVWGGMLCLFGKPWTVPAKRKDVTRRPRPKKNRARGKKELHLPKIPKWGVKGTPPPFHPPPTLSPSLYFLRSISKKSTEKMLDGAHHHYHRWWNRTGGPMYKYPDPPPTK